MAELFEDQDLRHKTQTVKQYYERMYKIRLKSDLTEEVIESLYKKMQLLKTEAPEYYRGGFF